MKRQFLTDVIFWEWPLEVVDVSGTTIYTVFSRRFKQNDSVYLINEFPIATCLYIPYWCIANV